LTSTINNDNDEATVIKPPDNAEFVMIPIKYLPLLQSISRGPFLPFDFPIPIIVSKMVPANEIWFGRTTDNGEYDIMTKEITDNDTLKALAMAGEPVDSNVSNDRLLSATGNSDRTTARDKPITG
jgi:hypothetical protein